MKRRKWTSEAKARIVLQGLKGLSVAEICNTHGISQSQYYLWRDQFLSHAGKAFDTQKVNQKQQHLESENEKLKTLVGELTVELKKTEGEWL
ncbi:MAG: transposase [Alphaproteobacteria bacterium]|nr:transposase [Alphaproteobacteria bacterium]